MQVEKVIAAILSLSFALIFFLFLHTGSIKQFKVNLFNPRQVAFIAQLLPTTMQEKFGKHVNNGSLTLNRNGSLFRVSSKISNATSSLLLPKPLFYRPQGGAMGAENHGDNNVTADLLKEKLILFYTTNYGRSWFPNSWASKQTLHHLDCPKKCILTENKIYANQADAVVFGILDTIYHTKYGEKKYPELRGRKTNQVWIGSTFEPSLYHNANFLFKLGMLFNWTASYRLDSDVYWPYGFFYKLNHPKELNDIDLPNTTILRTKKLAVSLISNCNAKSGRDVVINALRRYMTVDSFGKCGNLRCPDDSKCREFLGQHYKFFLAFENSLCQDYVTEKFFASFPLGMVPVTFGLGDYTEIAPPHSYINALDFPSAEALAQYLKYLDQNDQEYLKYFHWRREYAQGNITQENTFCNLCAKLWEPIKPKRITEGFNTWWNHKRKLNVSNDKRNKTLGQSLLQTAGKACVSAIELLKARKYL